MIHIGGMIGAGVSQSRSKTMGCELPFLRKFRNDKDRRDFIATGSACGVAAAFSAPIGGCLFAMEETSSFWSHAITWRTLFCCIVAAFFVDFVTQSTAGLTLNTPDALSHQAIFQVSSGGGKYLIFELIPFILLGVIGGLAGSAFIKLNLMVTSWRVRYIGARPMFRVLEVVFALFCWTTLVHLAPLLLPCNKIPAANRDSWDTTMLLRWTCTGEDEFSDLASLLSVSQTNALRNLLKQGAAAEFQPLCLAMFTLIYFFGSAMIAGSTLVSGLMVPFLIVGASYGRLVGVLMKTYVVPATTVIEPGLYALIGATSFFGGVSRMTISLSVIMLEITGDMTLLLPIMIAAMVAKWVGDRFTHSLYDLLIGIQSIPFLESEPAQLFNILDVSQVMSRNVRSFVVIPKIRDIVEMLQTTTHHGFPVVDTPNQPRLKGTILRTQLLVLLDTRVWHSTTARLTYSDFTSKMMNFKKTINEIVLSEEDMGMSISLEPYLNQSPFSVHEGFSLTIAFRLFRTMGLRHLPIVDQRNYVVGIITRKDLLEQVVEAKHEILMSKHQLQSGFRQVMKDLRSRSLQQHEDDLKATVS